jgi:hypothetical protein
VQPTDLLSPERLSSDAVGHLVPLYCYIILTYSILILIIYLFRFSPVSKFKTKKYMESMVLQLDSKIEVRFAFLKKKIFVP